MELNALLEQPFVLPSLPRAVALLMSELGQAELPVIIVTSLASEAHKRRGLEVGAQAYIVKSQFNQQSLLETVQQLLT